MQLRRRAQKKTHFYPFGNIWGPQFGEFLDLYSNLTEQFGFCDDVRPIMLLIGSERIHPSDSVPLDTLSIPICQADLGVHIITFAYSIPWPVVPPLSGRIFYPNASIWKRTHDERSLFSLYIYTHTHTPPPHTTLQPFFFLLLFYLIFCFTSQENVIQQQQRKQQTAP